jgi:hypothetical protein
MSSEPLDFNQISNLEKPNFYELDRNFVNNLPTLIEDDEMQDLCGTMLSELGEMCGSIIAKTAPENDEVGAQLGKGTFGGKETNVVKMPEGADAGHKLLKIGRASCRERV